MAQTIGRGGTITLDAYYRDGTNALVDPVGPLVSILDPNGDTIVLLDPPTRHVSTGHYQYDYPVPSGALLGAWAARWYGTINGGAVEDEDGFTVILPGTVAPSVGGDLHGPCTEWVTLGEVLNDPRAFKSDGTTPLDGPLLQTWIDVACDILYRLTARMYAGVCADVVRPTQRWYRTSYSTPAQWQAWYGRGVGGMTSRNPHRYEGLGPTSEISLGAYPIREVQEVRIDGAVLDPQFYRVDDRRWLVRLGPDGWPAAQDMAADPMTDPNTFQVTFTWGQAAPVGGVEACKAYAIEFAKAACGDECALPERVTSLQMQGVSMALLDPMTFLDDGKTGIYAVDAWIKSVNPNKLRRRSGVLSPDLPRPVRRTGTVPGS